MEYFTRKCGEQRQQEVITTDYLPLVGKCLSILDTARLNLRAAKSDSRVSRTVDLEIAVNCSQPVFRVLDALNRFDAAINGYIPNRKYAQTVLARASQ